MIRPFIFLALLLVTLGVVFYFAQIATEFLVVLILVSVALIAVGILTGK